MSDTKVEKSDFGKEVAKVYRNVKDDVTSKESIDKSIREQVASDLDHLIEKHEGT